MKLRLILLAPPAGIDYGLQSGQGPGYATVQTQRSVGKDLRFEFSVEVKSGAKKGLPDFRGPVVQGPSGGRFVYIDIGTYAGQKNTPWSRRLKIPLTGLTWAQVERASRDEGAVLEARVAGAAADGSPACASVKNFAGWKAATSRA